MTVISFLMKRGKECKDNQLRELHSLLVQDQLV